MSSLRAGGVKFVVYPQDHIPRHVHAFCGEAEIIIDLGDAGVSVAIRHDAIRPGNAKRSDIKKALSVAAEHHEELVALWESMQ